MTKKVEVHKRRMEMSFVTAGSAACAASAESSLKATSAMLLWTAEASQVEAMVYHFGRMGFMPMLGVRGGGGGEFSRCKKRKKILLVGDPKIAVLKKR